ncbi:rhombosortase [Niveibacterium terrae]|uniref:rhombosortase n=1 Tax=Niveibacterium terrae TaxID=3373598 RepID=UPI003A8DCF03
MKPDALPRLSLAAALACIAALALPDSANAQLALIRAALADGEAWRLWSAHFVHFSTQQALTDGAALLIAGAIVEPTLGTRRLGLLLLAGAPLIGLGTLALAPDLSEYRGASGLAVMLGAAACVLLWRELPRQRFFVAFVALLFIAKLALDAAGKGLDLSGLPPGVIVAWQAHLIGAALGLAGAWIPIRRS